MINSLTIYLRIENIIKARRKVLTMKIKEIKANSGNIEIIAEVVKKEEPRTFEKFGKSGKVCNAVLKDASGEVKLTLWNEDIDKVKVGDKVKLENGWCSEFKGEKQVSTGKFGKIEVVSAAVAEKMATEAKGTKEVFTNDPEVLGKEEHLENGEEEEEASVDEEELEDE